jgi:membrane-bound metal-dependent hydrolase YbcI (DUF457 family)
LCPQAYPKITFVPNKKIHLITGVLTGGIVALARAHYLTGQKDLTAETTVGSLSLLSLVLISAAVGGQFGLLPDLLEPATRKHWRHRRFFHSYTLLGLIIWFTYRTETNPELHELVRHFFTVAAAGYVSHLLLDSRTPAGIPWV